MKRIFTLHRLLWMKKVLVIVGVLVFVVIVVSILIFKLFPIGNLSFFKNADNSISNFICQYRVTVSGSSMEPILHNSDNVIFDRCFKEEELREGVIILYEDNTTKRIGIIREVQDLGRVVYRVSNEETLQRLVEISIDEIVGINTTDTSNSTYELRDEEQKSQELSDYMSEMYLGTIPRNQGLETSEVEETMTFNLEEDKFCYIVNPVIDLVNVDIEIVEKQTDSVIVSVADIVYEPGLNINCDDEPIGLGIGKYEFRLFIDNILVTEIDFMVE